MKVFALLTLMLISGAIYAQDLIISAGGSYVTGVFKFGENSAGIDENFTGFGFHGGASIEGLITGNRKQELIFSLGLFGDYKMASQKLSDEMKNDANLLYANVPAHVFYRYKLRSRDKIYAGIGPYVAMGVTGTIMGDKVKWGNEPSENHLKRLDYGVSGKIGFRGYTGLDIAIQYDYGIPDVFILYKSQSLKHRALRLSVGYSFSLVD